jgi:hypothetical protein
MLKGRLFALGILYCFFELVLGDGENTSLFKEDNNYLKPAIPFRATLIEYNKHNAQREKRTKLIMSDQGLRAELLRPNSERSQIIFIHNYRTEQKWLVNPGKHSYSELSDTSGLHTTDDADIEAQQEISPEMLDQAPCQGAKAEKLATRTVKNSELSVWECTDALGNKIVQHYSTLLGMVIRQQSDTGQVKELKNISLVGIGAQDFIPSFLWREVALEELIFSAPLLPEYVEK